MTARAVLLDLYDTLAGMDVGAIAAGRRRGAVRAGVEPDCMLGQWTGTVDARSTGGLGRPRDELRVLLRACGAHAIEDGLLDDLLQIEAANWREGVRLFADVLPALAALRHRGCRLAIVSNCSWQTAEVLAATGLAREVDVAVLSFQVGAMKPDPTPLRLALERLDADPARAVLVDDLAVNLDAARALGMATILMDRAGSAPATSHRAVRDLAAMASAPLS